MTRLRSVRLVAFIASCVIAQAALSDSPCSHLVDRSFTFAGFVKTSEPGEDGAVRYAYVAGLDSLRILDLADPAAPVEAASILIPELRDVIVQGGFAYVVAGSALKIFDLTSPEAPSLVATIPNRFIYQFFVKDGFAYLWGWNAGLRVIDVTVPSEPRGVGDFLEPAESWGPFEFVDSLVFANRKELDGTWRLQVIDLSDPTAPVEIASLVGEYRDLAISGDTLLALASPTQSDEWTLDLIDISDPRHPNLIASHHDQGHGSQVVAEGSAAFVWTDSGLDVVDFSDPNSLVASGPHGSGGGYYSTLLGVHQSHAYVTGLAGEGAERRYGVFIYDVNVPTHPVEMGFFEIPFYWCWCIANATFSEGLAFIADQDGGLLVVDVTVPSDPQVVAQPWDGWVVDVAVSGRYAYWLWVKPTGRTTVVGVGIRISDVTDPRNPIDLGNVDLGVTDDMNMQLAVSGSHAFVASASGLRVVYVGDVMAPREVGTLDVPGHAIAIHNSHAYIGSDPGMRVIDISDPENPEEVAYLDDATVHGRAIATAGSFAYVATGGSDGFRVIDISDPASPREVGTLDMPRTGSYPAGSIAVDGSFAYLALGEARFRVIDISDPTSPREVAAMLLGYHELAFAIAVSGDRAFLASSHLSMSLIDISDPTEPRLLENLWYSPMKIVIQGEYAFLAEREWGGTVVDISDCHRETNRGGRPIRRPH